MSEMLILSCTSVELHSIGLLWYGISASWVADIAKEGRKRQRKQCIRNEESRMIGCRRAGTQACCSRLVGVFLST